MTVKHTKMVEQNQHMYQDPGNNREHGFQCETHRIRPQVNQAFHAARDQKSGKDMRDIANVTNTKQEVEKGAHIAQAAVREKKNQRIGQRKEQPRK